VKKEMRTGVRFTKAEYFIVKGMALKAGMRYTGYIRHMALFGAVIPCSNDEERPSLKCSLVWLITSTSYLNRHTMKVCLRPMVFFENYRQQLDDIINWSVNGVCQHSTVR